MVVDTQNILHITSIDKLLSNKSKTKLLSDVGTSNPNQLNNYTIACDWYMDETKVKTIIYLHTINLS